MELIANTSKKHTKLNVQQLLTASLKIMLPLKAHTNKLFQFDRVTCSATPVTYSCGKLTNRYVSWSRTREYEWRIKFKQLLTEQK